MAKKKGRDCTECIAYCNMLGGEGYRCGLGFEVIEDVEPYENSCSSIELPTTKEEFVQTAAKLGIEWDIDEIADFDDGAISMDDLEEFSDDVKTAVKMQLRMKNNEPDSILF